MKRPQIAGAEGLRMIVAHMAHGRLWDHVEKTLSGCWEWKRYRTATGYGRLAFWFEGATYHCTVHRLAYALTNGLPVDGLHVCHRCDNPPCCNPDHLFLGTHQENMRDRNTKGRQPRGEETAAAKLTGAAVAELRDLVRGGSPVCALADALGVSAPSLYRAVHGRTWAHLPGAVDPRVSPYGVNAAALGREVGLGRERVRQLLARGNSVEEIRAGTYKRPNAGPRSRYTRIDIASVDWSLSNSAIAARLGCSPQAVRYARQRVVRTAEAA